MKLLELTLPTPAENVALDEALLEAAEAGELRNVLRFWESPQPMVVVGRSSRVESEIDLAACRESGVPVLRRASGGAAVVGGPGCLIYCLVLPYAGREHLRLIDELHRHVLGAMRSAIGSLVSDVEHVGICDLAVAGRKFSGNAVRCKRDHFLYHGTLLYNFDIGMIERLLKMPDRQPEYRGGRSHGSFLTNIGVPAIELRRLIANAFNHDGKFPDWPRERTAALVASRYSQDNWNFQR